MLAGLVLVLGLMLFVGSAKAATYTVTNTSDAGAGSLRQAITDANSNAGADTISFNIAGVGPHTIAPTSALPNVADQVTIDGFTQPGAGPSCGELVPASLPAGSNTPHSISIILDGGSVTDILTLNGTSGSTIVRGLVIGNIQQFGVRIDNVDNVNIECNYFGVSPDGTSVYGSNSGGIIGLTENSTIQNNLISSMTDAGVRLYSSNPASGSTISNNLIGTDASGNAGIANSNGINGFSNVSIDHNIISGNSVGINGGGQFADDYGASITGNYVGLSLAGTPLGNDVGINLHGVNDFTIGGTTAAQRNVISANVDGNGIQIYSDTSGCVNSSTNSDIDGNYIGSNINGQIEAGYGNSGSGIVYFEDFGQICPTTVYKHRIGTNLGNTIVGNGADGIRAYQAPGTDVFSIAMISNSIHGNGNLGINLAFDSTGSGTADSDLGPNAINAFLMSYPATNANYYINHPTINSSSFIGTQLSVNYSYQANGIQDSGDGYSLLQSDLVGYRLDFYLNDAGQDGAYAGYSQGKTHIGSFVVNGSETNASHTFTSPVTPTAGQVVTATATVLWADIPYPCPGPGGRYGDGPPYSTTSCE